MKRIIITALLAGMLIPLIDADARINNRSKYRKIQRGIGNCVFSNKPLGFKKERRYRLKKSFKKPDNVHVRCYFAKTLKEYSSRRYGKIDNSLMGMRPRRGGGPPSRYFRARLQFEQPIRYYERKLTFSRGQYGWDQVRLDMPLKGSKDDCEFTQFKFKRPNTCANIAEEVEAMKKRSSRVCVYIEFDKVDRKIWKRGKGWVKKHQFHILAKGCFRYRVK